MDKYQKVLLENYAKNCFLYCVSVKNGEGSPKTEFDYNNDILTITQDEDIFSTKYTLVLRVNTNIETCLYYINGAWEDAEQRGGCFVVKLDFENRIEKIKLTFADNIVDDYAFTVQYIEADKDLYYQKQAEEQKAKLLSAAQIKHSTGADLININFQPCCSDYEYTEIYLYIPQDYVTVGGPYGPVKKPSNWQLFKKCKVPSEDFYKSINGLAYGTYSYVIKQFDKHNQLLLETEHIEFKLSAPQTPNNAIRPRINKI